MTKIMKKSMHCKKCNKDYVVPVLLSTNSFMLEMDPDLRKKRDEGTLFENRCPVCGEKLVDIEDE